MQHHDSISPEATIRRQAAKDATYSAEYAKWVASLSPAERKQLARLGLDAPDTGYHQPSCVPRNYSVAVDVLPEAAFEGRDRVILDNDDPATLLMRKEAQAMKKGLSSGSRERKRALSARDMLHSNHGRPSFTA